MNAQQILASLSQLRHQKRPVTLVAVIFFSLVCLSLGGMQAWSVYRARAVQLEEAARDSTNLARALADMVRYSVDMADATLLDLGDRVQLESDGDHIAALDNYLMARLGRQPALQQLAVYSDSQGVTLHTGAHHPGADTVHKHLVHHRYLPDPELLIGLPQKDAEGQSWLLPVSRPWHKADGSFGGITLALIRMEEFRGFQERIHLGAKGRILLALTSGQLLLAHPARDEEVGHNLRGSTLFALRNASKDASGSTIVPASPGSGQSDILYSYQNVARYPLLVAVTRSSDDILASWWDSAYLSTAGVSLLMLIQMWVGVRLYGQITLRDQLEKERRSLQKILVHKSRSLRQQALRDALTGIANRRQFDTRLVREFNRAMTEGRPLALVILDVDHFKKYNDLYGHPAGDECLKFVASRINGGRRRTQDLAARLGGEEFAILLPGTGLRGAIAVAEAVRKSVSSQRLNHVPDQPHCVTVSCGVHALIPLPGMLPSELVDAADRALYLAKTSGRNRVRAEGSMPPGGGKRLSLVISK